MIVEKIRILRSCPYGLLDQRDAVGAAPGLVQQKPEEVQRRRMVALRRQYLAVNRLGFLYPPRLVQRQSPVDMLIENAAQRLAGPRTSASFGAFASS